MYINDHREEPFWQELLRSSHSKWHQIFYGFRSSFESRVTSRIAAGCFMKTGTTVFPSLGI